MRIIAPLFKKGIEFAQGGATCPPITVASAGSA